MSFQLVTDASELAAFPQEQSVFLGMWPSMAFGYRLYLIGLSGLFKKGPAGEFFQRLGKHDRRVKQGEAPLSLFDAILEVARNPTAEGAEEIKDRMNKGVRHEVEAIERHAEKDVAFFGTPDHRPRAETLKAIMLLPREVGLLIRARAKTKAEPFLVHEELASLNETMTKIMQDPAIDHCPEPLQFAQILYLQATAEKPELDFDEAALRLGSPLRFDNFAQPEDRFNRPHGGGRGSPS